MCALMLMLLRTAHMLVGLINNAMHINVNTISANINDDICSANVCMCISDINY